MIPISPQISMNRVRIMDLPGLRVPSEVKGRLSGELISASTINGLIRQHANKLELDSALNDHELNLAFDACFDSPESLIRNMAETIARRIGSNLGYILAVLKRGDEINRAARPEWDSAYWEHWANIQHVILGGGWMSGNLGKRMYEHALQILEKADVHDLQLRLSPHADNLCMIGAARYAPSSCDNALVLDFGGTNIKRGCAAYHYGELQGMVTFPSQKTGWFWVSDKATDSQITLIFEDMVNTIVETWQLADTQLSNSILISMASYIENGHPMDYQGGTYTLLRKISSNLQNALGQRLSYILNMPINVVLLHDGTAAASVFAGAKDTAVITIGTAMGVGFPPPRSNLRSLSPNLMITQR